MLVSVILAMCLNENGMHSLYQVKTKCLKPGDCVCVKWGEIEAVFIIIRSDFWKQLTNEHSRSHYHGLWGITTFSCYVVMYQYYSCMRQYRTQCCICVQQVSSTAEHICQRQEQNYMMHTCIMQTTNKKWKLSGLKPHCKCIITNDLIPRSLVDIHVILLSVNTTS